MDDDTRGPQGIEGPEGPSGPQGKGGKPGPAGPAGKSASEAVTLLPGAFNRLTDALHHDARRRRWQALAFVVLFAIGLGGTFIQSANNGKVIGRVESTAEDVEKVVTVLESVTGPEAQQRNAAATKDVLTRNAIEVDCRFRRQHAGLSAPDPGSPCAAQTPPEVYPGPGTPR